VKQIIIEHIVIDVERKPIKHLHLAVHRRSGRVRISSPLHFTHEAIRLFAVSKLHWIQKHRERAVGQAQPAPMSYTSGELHYYGGKQYALELVCRKGTPAIELNGVKMRMYVRAGTTRLQRTRVLIEWYREKLKEQIPAIVDTWESRMGVQLYGWRVKRMRTKWGTCNITAKRIWLNLELVKLPFHCLEYVVVHEMVHLLERKHSRTFTAHMDTFLPNWRSIKEELNHSLRKSVERKS
jgi:predicted metal-dependent hydrolase